MGQVRTTGNNTTPIKNGAVFELDFIVAFAITAIRIVLLRECIFILFRTTILHFQREPFPPSPAIAATPCPAELTKHMTVQASMPMKLSITELACVVIALGVVVAAAVVVAVVAVIVVVAVVVIDAIAVVVVVVVAVVVSVSIFIDIVLDLC